MFRDRELQFDWVRIDGNVLFNITKMVNGTEYKDDRYAGLMYRFTQRGIYAFDLEFS